MATQYTLVSSEAFNAHTRKFVASQAAFFASAQTYSVGEVVTCSAEGFAYEIMPVVYTGADAITHPVTGQVLKVLPGKNGYDVKAFGAKGDGTTDDTDAFKAALNTQTAVHIPLGTYRIADTLPLYARQTITGVGDQTILNSEVVGGYVFDVGAENIWATYLSDFRIAGGGSESGGIYIADTYNGVSIARVNIIGVGGKGLHLKSVIAGDFEKVWVEGQFVTEYGLYVEGATTTNFRGCNFRETINTGAGAVLKRGDWAITAVLFDGCYFESNESDGIVIHRSAQVTFDACYWEANNRYYLTDTNARASHVSLPDLDASGEGSAAVTIRNPHFQANYVEFNVKASVPIEGLIIENPNVWNWTEGTAGPIQGAIRYDIDFAGDLSAWSHIVGVPRGNVDMHDVDQRLSSVAQPSSVTEDVSLVYYDSGFTAIEGTIPATITTRTMLSGGLKCVVFAFDSVDVSGVPTNRVVGLQMPFKRFSVGRFTDLLMHSGTSATGVLQFFAESNVSSNDFYLRKTRVAASGTTTARTDDLVGVTRLAGSVTYF